MKNEFDKDYSKTEYLLFKWFEIVGYFEGKMRKLKEFILSIWNTPDNYGL